MKKLLNYLMAVAELSLVACISIALSQFVMNDVYIEFVGVAFVSILSLLLLFKEKGVAFETIPVDQVRAAMTNMMVEFYQERPVVKSFLKSLFPEKNADTKYISIEVQRGSETLAVDMVRGTGSNMNQITKSTVKTFLPNFYSEEISLNELEVYNVAYGTLNPSLMRRLAQDQAFAMGKMIDKIDRTYEKQRADVLQSGVVYSAAGDSIDFRRKADSIVDDNTKYWNSNSNDPLEAFENAGKFLREEGKIQMGPGSVYLCILGGKALNDLLNNEIFQKKADLKRLNVLDVVPAQMGIDGASYHGRVSAGSYLFDLWTYPEVYQETVNGPKIKYIDDTNLIVTSYKPNFNFTYGMVPQLPGIVVPMTVKQGFYTLEWLDPKMMNHGAKVMSAGVAVPYGIDQVYTQKVTPTA